MPDIALAAILAFALAFLCDELTSGGCDPETWPQALSNFAFFWLFSFAALWTLWPAAILKSHVFPPPPDRGDLVLKFADLVIWGIICFSLPQRFSDRRGQGARFGTVLGFFAFMLGLAARQWLPLIAALNFQRSLYGSVLETLLPILMAVALALALSVILSKDFRSHGPSVLGSLLICLFMGAWFSRQCLQAYWGYGPQNLAEAIGVARDAPAETVVLTDLRPWGRKASRSEKRQLAEDGVAFSMGNLSKLYVYLRQRRYRSLFAPQALKVLREGWLGRWDLNRALAAAMLFKPGRAAPDYLRSLALIRAGPVTMGRYQQLQALNRLARLQSDGIIEIGRAQSVFEAFEAAYARFGDRPNALFWFNRYGKIRLPGMRAFDVTPLEPYIRGRIDGSVQITSNETGIAHIVVGLLFISSSPTGGFLEGTLSETALPDEAGRFVFSDLGPGRYYLALLSAPLLEGATYKNVPGILTLSTEQPSLALPAIRIYVHQPTYEPVGLEPFDLQVAPP
jgi:hypothetical protein